jgi:hypothetical protein
MRQKQIERLSLHLVLRWRIWVGVLVACVMVAQVQAQEPSGTEAPAVNVAGSPILPGSVPTDVWVTTQDYVAFGSGPAAASLR